MFDPLLCYPMAENDPAVGMSDINDRDSNSLAGIVVDGNAATVGDPTEAGVFDSAAVKRKAIESATEAATMIARIDDVITAESSR